MSLGITLKLISKCRYDSKVDRFGKAKTYYHEGETHQWNWEDTRPSGKKYPQYLQEKTEAYTEYIKNSHESNIKKENSIEKNE